MHHVGEGMEIEFRIDDSMEDISEDRGLETVRIFFHADSFGFYIFQGHRGDLPTHGDPLKKIVAFHGPFVGDDDALITFDGS